MGIVYHSCSGRFSIRVEDWVYIDGNSGDDNKEPEWFKEERGYVSHNYPKELYDLKSDPQQKNNLYNDYPDKSQYLATLLDSYRNKQGSRL